jgi:hypothetical protein
MGTDSDTMQDFAYVALSLRRSMAIFGTMRPKVIAKIIMMAVMPSAIVALRRMPAPWYAMFGSTSSSDMAEFFVDRLCPAEVSSAGLFRKETFLGSPSRSRL